MIVRVDVSANRVELVEPEVLQRLHISAEGDAESIARALGEHGRPSERADHFWVRIDSLRALAAGRVSATWGAEFDRMIEYARGKGWLDAEGTHVSAHVERP